MTIFMYTVPITSWTMTIYTTCYGMTLATITLGMEEAIILRINLCGSSCCNNLDS